MTETRMNINIYFTYLLTYYKMSSSSSSSLTVVILAGGKGTRMKSDLPKVLHKVDGIPMILRVLRSALTLQPRRVIVVVNENTEVEIKTLLTNNCKLHTHTEFVFVVQLNPIGTGHALQLAVSHLLLNETEKEKEQGKVIVLCGDTPNIQPALLQRFVNDSDGAIASFIAFRTAFQHGYGRVIMTNATTFKCILEEKDCQTDEERAIDLVNGGIYVFTNEFLKQFVYRLQRNNTQRELYITDLLQFAANIENENVYIHIVPPTHVWQLRGVNTFEELQNAQQTYFLQTQS